MLVLLLSIFLLLFPVFHCEPFCLHGFSLHPSLLCLSHIFFTLSLFSKIALHGHTEWTSKEAVPPVSCPLISHTREEMLFFKVPVQLSKEEVANAKNSKKLVSAHYEEKNQEKMQNTQHLQS